MYDFDSKIDRNTPDDIKHKKVEGIDDLIPMWVADMDFRCPPEVSEALAGVALRGVFGYSQADEAYYEAVTGWFKRRYDWEVKSSEIITVPGVIAGLVCAIRALSEPGDHILIFQPVYGPFERCIRGNDRIPSICELKNVNGHYEADLEEAERMIVEDKIRLLIWCSPHNPGGRVWTYEELKAVSDLCIKHGVFIVSDEIHADLILGGRKHIPIAKLSKEAAQNSMVLSSPTKTFNIAGIQAANIIVKNPEIYEKIDLMTHSSGVSEQNKMGITATGAAYSYGEAWLDELLEYIGENVDLVMEELKDTELVPMKPEGTYLIWIDCSALSGEEPFSKILLEKAHVRVSEGEFFGKGGGNFIRLNVACPRSVLKEGIKRIKAVL